MTLIHMAFLGIAPAALVGLLGVLVRSRQTGKTTTTLWPMFLICHRSRFWYGSYLASFSATRKATPGRILSGTDLPTHS